MALKVASTFDGSFLKEYNKLLECAELCPDLVVDVQHGSFIQGGMNIGCYFMNEIGNPSEVLLAREVFKR